VRGGGPWERREVDWIKMNATLQNGPCLSFVNRVEVGFLCG